jgi:hypothetical protein
MLLLLLLLVVGCWLLVVGCWLLVVIYQHDCRIKIGVALFTDCSSFSPLICSTLGAKGQISKNG